MNAPIIPLPSPQTLLTAVLGVTAPPSRLSREFKLLPQDADLSRDPGPVSDLILQLQVSTDNVLQRASKTGGNKYTVCSAALGPRCHELN